MSVNHKESSIQKLKQIKDNLTLTQNVQSLETESTITNEAVIEAWVSSMEVTDAVLELANMVFSLLEVVADLEVKVTEQGEGVNKNG